MIWKNTIIFAILASLICFATGYIPASYERVPGHIVNGKLIRETAVHTWLWGNMLLTPIAAAISFFIMMKILSLKHWAFIKNKGNETIAKMAVSAIISFILISPIFWILAIAILFINHILFGTSIDM